MSGVLFPDRREAGRRLAERITEAYGSRLPRVLVLALPRGGVPVAAEVAHAVGAPLDVLVARKIGAPHNPELGVGALAAGGPAYYDPRTLGMLGLSRHDMRRTEERERAEVARREELYRRGRPALDADGRTVLLVDDGLATGVTARAALRAVRAQHPHRTILAVPVAAPGTAEELRAEADAVVCVHAPPGFMAVGQFYLDFTQVTDAEVVALLAPPEDPA